LPRFRRTRARFGETERSSPSSGGEFPDHATADVTLVNMASATYHHGNLRQALLEHAVDLARSGGPDAVVLRDVQRAAGVSNSAAYRHYSDRQALLTSVQIHGMTLLGDAMLEALTQVPNRGPRDRRALARFRATGCEPLTHGRSAATGTLAALRRRHPRTGRVGHHPLRAAERASSTIVFRQKHMSGKRKSL